MEASEHGHLVRDAGIALVVAAVASVLLMMNHPSDAHAGVTSNIVHAGMIMALAAMLFGFLVMARLLGPTTSAIAGSIAFAISAGAHFGAATINGFAVPAMAAWPRGAPGHDVFLLAWQLNQGLAHLGIFATGAAFLAWGIALRRSHPLLAASGALAGIVPAALLATGVIKLDVHGALLAYGIHSLWALAVGVTMVRGKFAPAA